MNSLQLPQNFVVRREVYVFQLFERSALKRIPPDTVILVSHRSTHKRMIEVIWEEKWYVAFERDVHERMEPLNKPENEDDPCRTSGAGSYK